jgi:hypothetical protein
MEMKFLRCTLALLLLFVATSALAESDARKAFAQMKTLAGTWEGKTSSGQTGEVVYRVTSNGSALLSEIKSGPEDMITMFHLDGDRLLMTHYCGAGNQPRMKATLSPDGKSVTFEFLDATNLSSPKAGHMHRAVFTMVDANHHTEEWIFAHDGKEQTEKFELQRKN